MSSPICCSTGAPPGSRGSGSARGPPPRPRGHHARRSRCAPGPIDLPPPLRRVDLARNGWGFPGPSTCTPARDVDPTACAACPTGDPRPRPGQLGVDRPDARCATPSIWCARPSNWATGAIGLPNITSIRAWPGSAPALLIAMAAAATDHIRVGSGGVQSGHRTALRGRGVRPSRRHAPRAYRPGHRKVGWARLPAGSPGRRDSWGVAPVGEEAAFTSASHGERAAHPGPAVAARAGQHGPRYLLTVDLLQQKNAESADYDDLLSDILDLLRGTYRSADGLDPHPVPGTGADVEPWVLGSSAGESAEVAGRLGHPFRGQLPHQSGDRPGRRRRVSCRVRPLARRSIAPMSPSSADVVVAPDDEIAAQVWPPATRLGSAPFARARARSRSPAPTRPAGSPWNEEERALVARPGGHPVRRFPADRGRPAPGAP